MGDETRAAGAARHVILLTGDKGVGKSTVCQQLAARARAAGYAVTGVLSPPEVAPDGGKVGIWVEDARTGARRRLAVATHLRRGLPVETTHWSFNEAVLQWGAEVIAQATPCDLLLIDELGPLELERGAGWTAAFDVLCGGDYRWAVVVVRPSLCAPLRHRLAGLTLETVHVTDANRDALPGAFGSRLWGA